MKVEVAVLGSPSLIVQAYGLSGRKAILNSNNWNSDLVSELAQKLFMNMEVVLSSHKAS